MPQAWLRSSIRTAQMLAAVEQQRRPAGEPPPARPIAEGALTTLRQRDWDAHSRDFGGWIIARYQLQVNTSLYWASVVKGLYMTDAWMGITKPFVFGFLIVTIACHVGMRTAGGTAGVGKATTLSVVAGSVAVIAADFFVTQLFIWFFY